MITAYIATFLIRLVEIFVAFYVWSLIAYVAMGWLIHFRIIHPYQPGFYQFFKILVSIHEPILRPIRGLLDRVLPNMGGIDFSPLVALLLANLVVVPVAREIIVLLAAMFYIG